MKWWTKEEKRVCVNGMEKLFQFYHSILGLLYLPGYTFPLARENKWNLYAMHSVQKFLQEL